MGPSNEWIDYGKNIYIPFHVTYFHSKYMILVLFQTGSLPLVNRSIRNLCLTLTIKLDAVRMN